MKSSLSPFQEELTLFPCDPTAIFFAPIIKSSHNLTQTIVRCNSIHAQMVVARNQRELDAFRVFSVEIKSKHGRGKKIIYSNLFIVFFL